MILMDLKIDIGDIKTAILVVRLDSDSSEGSECVFLAYFNENQVLKDFCGLKMN